MKPERLKELKIYKRRKVFQKKKAFRKYILNSLPRSERKFETGAARALSHRLLTLKVPSNFSTSIDVDEVLAFVNKCKDVKVLKHRLIQIDFRKAREVNAAALSLLLAVIQELVDLKIKIKGNMPKHIPARKAFIESGFLEFVVNEQGLSATCKNKIIVKGEHRVDQHRTGREILKAMKTISGNAKHNPPVQGAVIEMMANSLNHAFPEDDQMPERYYEAFMKNKRWYFSAFHNEDNNEVEFSFIDNGVGLLSTIKRGKFKQFVEYLTDADIIEKAFNGEYRSRTLFPQRGKGLPTVKKAHQKAAIRHLKVLTNEQLYDFETRKCKKLANGFTGTCYFWKIDQSCEHGTFKNQ